MGMTMVLVSGEVDLSVGSVYGFAAIASGLLMTHGFPIWLSFGAGLIGGMGFGILNGLLVTYGRIPSLIVTLGMLNVARGVALVASNAYPISINSRTVEVPSIGVEKIRRQPPSHS